MVREFKLINEKGQEYSLMDIRNYCLLTEPSGLGYSYNREYEQLGNTFVETFGKIEQKQIEGTVNFLNYDNFKNFVNFIEGSEQLKFSYTIPFENETEKTYYKDVNIRSLEKSEKKKDGIISEQIVFDTKSLWYGKNIAIYDTRAKEDEIRWNFKWDSKFVNYDIRRLPYINKGHVEAPVIVKIDGHVINPSICLYVEGKLFQEVKIKVDIKEYEKLLYGTEENNFYINKQNIDGTLTSLFTLENIIFQNDNVIRIPVNRSCELTLTADNEIANAEIMILEFYKIV